MLRKTFIALLLSTGEVLSQTPNPPPNLTPLFNHIWRITTQTPYPNSGSIYIFLPSGTLLETSCVETYRIATWKVDPKQPSAIEITEDGRLAFTATISALTGTTPRLHQTMALGNHEVRDVNLTAIDKEFVCPDMPK
jgi:hypothetical protein